MSRGHARRPSSEPHPARRRGRRRAAATALAAGALAVGTAMPAGAATDPLPAPGLAVGVASVGGGAPVTAVDMFYQRADHHLVQKNGAGVTDLGGALTSGAAAVAARPGGAVTKTVAVRANDTSIWLRTWTQATGWQAWRTLGGKALGAPGITCTGDGSGHPVLYVRGLDRALWRSTGGAWVKVGGTPASDPSALASVGGACPASEHVFTLNTDGYLWEWTPAGGFRRVGGRSTVAPSATLLPDGGTNLFARGPDNAAWVAQRAAGATVFNPFQRIGGAFTSPVTGFVDTTEPADRLVLGVGTGGSLSIASDELGGDPAWVWGEVP